MLILFKWGNFGWGESLNVMGIKGGVNFFRIKMGLKTLKTRGVPIYFGVQYLTTYHEILQNLCFTKVLVPLNFLSLRNLASHYIPWISKEIVALQKLYFCFEVFFLLGFLLRTLDGLFFGVLFRFTLF